MIGKYLYCWHPRLYPGQDVVAYAQKLGVRGVVLLDGSGESVIERAVEVFDGRVYLWKGPNAFLPHNAVETTQRMARVMTRLGGAGFVTDAETAPQWRGNMRELQAFGEAMKAAKQSGLDVGFTSFPLWPYVRQLGQFASFGSPQMYARRGPQDYQLFGRWRRKWDESYPAVNPSIWPQGHRSRRRVPAEQREYLRLFEGETVIVFQSPVSPVGSPSFNVLSDFFSGGNTIVPKCEPPA